MSDRELRKFRGPDLGLIFQEPMTRLNPLMRIDQHFAETLKQHEPGLNDAEVRRRSLETLGRMGIPADADSSSTRTSSRAECASAS
jgi:peptide/nickel transport system ATP-binding protein